MSLETQMPAPRRMRFRTRMSLVSWGPTKRSPKHPHLAVTWPAKYRASTKPTKHDMRVIAILMLSSIH